MASGFHDVQFPPNISKGVTGGPSFRTTVIRAASGYEQRMPEWDESLMKWNVGSAIWNKSRLDELLAFFYARQGRAYAFRFKDWSDYFVGMSWDTGQLTHDPANRQVIGVGDGTRAGFQLVKTYTSGGVTRTRKITRPVADSVRVYVNGVEVPQYAYVRSDARPNTPSAGYTSPFNVGAGIWYIKPSAFAIPSGTNIVWRDTAFTDNPGLWELTADLDVGATEMHGYAGGTSPDISAWIECADGSNDGVLGETDIPLWVPDYSAGAITFATPPSAGAEVAWSGQFDVPARFDTDDMEVNIEGIGVGAWPSIPLVGVRE